MFSQCFVVVSLCGCNPLGKRQENNMDRLLVHHRANLTANLRYAGGNQRSINNPFEHSVT